MLMTGAIFIAAHQQEATAAAAAPPLHRRPTGRAPETSAAAWARAPAAGEAVQPEAVGTLAEPPTVCAITPGAAAGISPGLAAAAAARSPGQGIWGAPNGGWERRGLER